MLRSRRTGAALAVLLAVVVFCGAPSPVSAEGYEYYVGCSTTEQTVPSTACPIGTHPGAFFRSSTDVRYTVCVVFPDGRRLCSSDQVGDAGTLYVNRITSDIVGLHEVSWSVGGQVVGTWTFTMEPRDRPLLPKALVSDASHRFEVRPDQISYTGDGTGFVAGPGTGPRAGEFGPIEWRQWGPRRAYGVGVNWINDCHSGCATGSFDPHAATIVLRRVRHHRFTRMTIRSRWGSRYEVDRRQLLRLTGVPQYIWG